MRVGRVRERWECQGVGNRYRPAVTFEFETSQRIVYRAGIYNKGVHRSRMLKDRNFGAAYRWKVSSSVRKAYCSHHRE